LRVWTRLELALFPTLLIQRQPQRCPFGLFQFGQQLFQHALFVVGECVLLCASLEIIEVPLSVLIPHRL